MITPGWPGLCTAGNVEGGTRGRDGTSYQGHQQASGGDDGNEDDDDDDDYDDDDDNDNGDHVDVDDDFDMIETEPLTDRLLDQQCCWYVNVAFISLYMPFNM